MSVLDLETMVKIGNLDRSARKLPAGLFAVLFFFGWIVGSCVIRLITHRPYDVEILVGAFSGALAIIICAELTKKIRDLRSKRPNR